MVQLVKKFILLACLGLISLKGFGQCTEDCVWPGDLNANGIVNALDALAFGFALDSMGPARSNMSTDWQALEADDWIQNLPELGTNFKHIDANGNGIVEENDQFIISVNYDLTNDNFVKFLGLEHMYANAEKRKQELEQKKFNLDKKK